MLNMFNDVEMVWKISMVALSIWAFRNDIKDIIYKTKNGFMNLIKKEES